MSDRELKNLQSLGQQSMALGGTWRETELLASTEGKTAAQGQWNEAEFSLYRYTPNLSVSAVA